MAHIHTKPGQHDLTTTAFVIRTDGTEPRGLLHVHRKLGLLLPIGGHVELNENPWAAVQHELKEESGYGIEQLVVLQPTDRILEMSGVKSHPVPLFLQTHEFKKDADHFHVDVGFCFVATAGPKAKPAYDESQELLWLTQAEISERRKEMPADIAEIFDFCFDVALQRWDKVDPSEFDT